MRITAVRPIETRDGTLSKDEVLRNFMVDPLAPEKVMKRPAMVKTELYAPAGQSLGVFVFNDMIYSWTDETSPTYPANYDYVPDYWPVGGGSGGGGAGGGGSGSSGSGNYDIRWEDDNQIVEVPDNVFNEIQVGDRVTITGVSPSGYNGTCLYVADKKTAQQLGVGRGNSILITNLTNPGLVSQGGVVKRLRPCTLRRPFPNPAPEGYGLVLNDYLTGLPIFTHTRSSVNGSDNCGPDGSSYTIAYQTTTGLLYSDGYVRMSGSQYSATYYTGATPTSGYANYSSLPSGGGGVPGQYGVTYGSVQTGTSQCGDTIDTYDNVGTATVTVYQSNKWRRNVVTYQANLDAWTGMCCS